ncbi:O-antigen ligase family protein [Bosea sp. SSUT16]|uniref:O-antigen ligase family protein n=1 Tax=Bosea spartocytisi TaxID=2773451 RepID=A0A927E3N7_9HYPH|nr:O-antigen ligase family protein [Bosea spartocytisi]MBD3844221.1 O-antigen ligase family protein [Bosea spartocytisi]MCT4470670.1 O-antigen ligase family protein [Bosea spartocytisi]
MSQPRLPVGQEAVSTSSLLSTRLVAAGSVLMVLMPLAMWLANRSAPLMLGLGAMTFIAAAVAAGRAGEVVARLRSLLATPLGLALAAFLAWALLSILWSHRPAASLRAWAELVLPAVFALAIAASGRFRPQPAWLRALAVAIILASLLAMVELASGLSQRAELGIGKLMSFVFNRPAITALVLAVPTIHGLWHMPAARRSDRILAVLLGLTVAALALRSESASARLGVAVCLVCWVASAYWPRLMLTAAAIGLVLTMAMAPVLGLAAHNWLPSVILNRFAVMTGQARIDIWQSFGEVVRVRPIAGAGFGTSASMDRHPVAAEVAPEHRVLLGVGHPHDMPLQAWVETGAIGAGILLAAGLLLLARLRRLPAREMAPRLALFAAAFAISVVGHGAWQGWWIAVLGAGILWFGPGAAARQGEDHG